MNRINQGKINEVVNALLERQEGVHISWFTPLEWDPGNLSANRIRLKNFIKESQQKITDGNFLPPDLPQPDMAELFEPAQNLLTNGRLPAEQGQSLAIFLAPGVHYIFTLARPLPESVVIGPRFHILPLLPLLNSYGRFYLLTLSQNQAHLWLGSPFNLEKVELPILPNGMDEALALEDPERSLQYHTSTESRRDRPAAFHGHDAEKEKKGAILRYCREVNKAVQEALTGKEIPLLIASVAYLQSLYQEENSYPQLLPAGLTGNPDNLSPQELHQQAWHIIKHHLEQTKSAAWQQFQELAGTENTSQSPAEIIPAAAYGRVDTLFVSTTGQKWGRFYPSSGEIEPCQADVFDCEDLLNLAAVLTLTNGGTVYTLSPEKSEGKAKLAALFRYVN